MNRTTLALLILCLIASAGAQTSITPPGGSNSPDCHEARTWHLQMALKYSEAASQEYHLGAADAAYMLAEYGPGACVGWETDARAPAPSQAMARVSGDSESVGGAR